MHSTKLEPYETLRKLNSNVPMVEDDDLKYFMERSLNVKKDNLKSIQRFINNTQ
ncbi:hypothetical protein ACSVC9_14475 [Clostridium sp. LBM24168]